MFKHIVRPTTKHENYLNDLGLEEHESIIAARYWYEYNVRKAKERGEWDGDE